MDADSRLMRGDKPFVFTNCLTGEGIADVVDLIRRNVLFDSGAGAGPGPMSVLDAPELALYHGRAEADAQRRARQARRPGDGASPAAATGRCSRICTGRRPCSCSRRCTGTSTCRGCRACTSSRRRAACCKVTASTCPSRRRRRHGACHDAVGHEDPPDGRELRRRLAAAHPGGQRLPGTAPRPGRSRTGTRGSSPTPRPRWPTAPPCSAPRCCSPAASITATGNSSNSTCTPRP